MPAPVILDFETDGIEPRPKYPPKPVGVGIWEPGRAPVYLAWGHPTENNCRKVDARRRLRDIWRGNRMVVCHNAAFDVDVAANHMGLRWLPWHRIHCTQVLSFLTYPERKQIHLKTLAAELLGIMPDERDELQEWILANVPEATQTTWGAYISRAPGKLAGRYCKADLVMTKALLKHLESSVWYSDRRFQEAYERERRVLQILATIGEQGIPVDTPRLVKDEKSYTVALDRTDNYIRKQCKIPDLDIDSKQDLAYGLVNGGFLIEKQIPLTPKAKKHSLRKDVIESLVTDEHMKNVLLYRSFCAWNLRTFFRPWSILAQETGGYVPAVWNSVKQVGPDGKTTRGARTGRLSSSPNAQNVSKEPPEAIRVRLRVPPLPFMREYVMAPVGQLLVDVDAAQQEIRMLAMLEGNELLRMYQKNPRVDVYAYIRDVVNSNLGLNLDRNLHVKTTVLGIIYGEGIKLIAKKMRVTEEEAAFIKNAVRKAIPGLFEIERRNKLLAAQGEPQWTIGGRPYICEDPIWVEDEDEPDTEFGKGKKKLTFEYKMTNTYCQGSAADHIKQTMINYDAIRIDGWMCANVHDELLSLAARGAARRELKLMKEAMEDMPYAVPMVADGGVGKTWAIAK
jgi:DNA polymerase I-like protein with 3'-5' exonuclease and polymerase domains